MNHDESRRLQHEWEDAHAKAEAFYRERIALSDGDGRTGDIPLVAADDLIEWGRLHDEDERLLNEWLRLGR